jgi:hypothetical protein
MGSILRQFQLRLRRVMLRATDESAQPPAASEISEIRDFYLPQRTANNSELGVHSAIRNPLLAPTPDDCDEHSARAA